MEFKEFPKMPRLSQETALVTEKIDGTNAQIFIQEECRPFVFARFDGSTYSLPFLVGSRSRWITPEQDNYGFARWAYDHADQLVKLGAGRHYGEWWGSNIKRGYNQDRRRFSLFNALRWTTKETPPPCCDVVPILHCGTLDTLDVDKIMADLAAGGSKAAPGFMQPEGIVIYYVKAGFGLKNTFDDRHKGEVNATETYHA